MTYSIVARDPESGALGCAVQSHFFSVGPNVPWVEPGVAAVASQALADPSYGPRTIAGVQRGAAASDVLDQLLEADPQREYRQVIGVDAHGHVGTHTGRRCIAEAGHVAADQVAAAANLMRHPGVPQAMVDAYHTASGDLADRLLAALRAAEARGGDLRGQQSAAIVVMSGVATGDAWKDRVFDLRVEDHPEPVTELERLVRLRRAYRWVEVGSARVAAGDLEGARLAFRQASELAPEVVEIEFWQAVSLFGAGERSEALSLFRRVFRHEPHWRDLLLRLVEPGYVPDHDTAQRILEQTVTSTRRTD